MEDDAHDKDDTKRRTRNLSEKKRRDQFNMLVNELGSIISTSNRRMDKSTVLKSTISFLKNHNEVTVRSRAHDVQEDWKPEFLSNEEFTYLMLEALEGFVMVFSTSGRIYYVSESITSLLGHNPNDVVNQTIFDLTYEDDRQNLYSILQNAGAGIDTSQQITRENEIKFECHLQRSTLDFRDEAPSHELVQFNGHFRTNIEQTDSDDASSCNREQESRLLFVCVVRLSTPHLIKDVSLIDANQNEFASTFSMEWKFLFLDNRAPPIIGYLPFEVLGTSGYDYYHFDDIEKVISCHESLMQKGELTSCYYRFLTKGQQWIWLKSRFYITYHQWNCKPEFVVCTHRVVSYADVLKSKMEENTKTETPNEIEQPQEAMKTTPTEDVIASVSPSYMSESSEAFNSYQPQQLPLTQSQDSDQGQWHTVTSEVDRRHGGSPEPFHHSIRNTKTLQHQLYEHSNNFPQSKIQEPILVLQHNVGAQYLEPASYVAPVNVSGVVTLPQQSAPVSHDQAQLQEQLQRKHEELQQMIVRQQEELRQVKEQLLLARLGILNPLINVQNSYATPEEIQQNQRQQAQIVYEDPPRSVMGYSPQPPASAEHPSQQNPHHYMPR